MCQGDKEIYDIAVGRRTIRQFKPDPLPSHLLEKLVEAARLAPSAANLQPLEYIAVDDKRVCGEILPCLKWAAYIAPEGDPKPGREPVAYVVTLVNTKVREKMFEYDAGAAMENMILAALGEGVGSCWLLSIDRDKLKGILASRTTTGSIACWRSGTRPRNPRRKTSAIRRNIGRTRKGACTSRNERSRASCTATGSNRFSCRRRSSRRP